MKLCPHLHQTVPIHSIHRQVVHWAYGVLGRDIRKAIPSCVAAISSSLQEKDKHIKVSSGPVLKTMNKFNSETNGTCKMY